jgi:hypothetical protein
MEDKIEKNIPMIQFDQKERRMKTWTMRKRVINSTLKKRIIDSDKISTYPLRRQDGTLF